MRDKTQWIASIKKILKQIRESLKLNYAKIGLKSVFVDMVTNANLLMVIMNSITSKHLLTLNTNLSNATLFWASCTVHMAQDAYLDTMIEKLKKFRPITSITKLIRILRTYLKSLIKVKKLYQFPKKDSLFSNK